MTQKIIDPIYPLTKLAKGTEFTLASNVKVGDSVCLFNLFKFHKNRWEAHLTPYKVIKVDKKNIYLDWNFIQKFIRVIPKLKNGLNRGLIIETKT